MFTDFCEVTEMAASSLGYVEKTRTSEKLQNFSVLGPLPKATQHSYSKSLDLQLRQIVVERSSFNAPLESSELEKPLRPASHGRTAVKSESKSNSGSELDQEAIKRLAKKLDFRQVEKTSRIVEAFEFENLPSEVAAKILPVLSSKS